MRQKLFAIVVAFITLITVPAVVGAQIRFAEVQFNLTPDGALVNTVDMALESAPLSDGYRVSFWALKTEGWGEAYIGFARDLSGWASASLAIGVEQDDRPLRLGGYLWMGGRGISSLLILEDGGSGPYWKYVFSTGVSDRLSVGVLSQRFVGTGPYLEVRIRRFTLWSAPVAFGAGGVQSLSGIRLGFK